MTSPWYNPTFLVRNTRALAEAVNAELAKIKSAFDQLPAPGSVGSGVSPVFTHFAYADSADGTSNFTTGAPGNRTYIGVQANVASATPSGFPADYEWSRITGTDGDPGEDGQYRDFRFIRSASQPTQATGNTPAGTSDAIPEGTAPVWVTSAVRNGAGVLQTPWEPWVRLSALPAAVGYDAATTYYEGMQVLFNGGTYILTVASSIGNAPSGTDQPNTWWDVAAAPGPAGAPAVPPSGFSATIDLTSSSSGVNLRTIANAAGYTGMSDATITFRVPNGVTIRGSAGGLGIDSGTWPSSSYTIALTLEVQSGGIVDGGGGIGGDGGSGGSGTPGTAGGDAIFLRESFSGGITINVGGTVRGGGGGGGGGRGQFNIGPFGDSTEGAAGGGGGGGAPNGPGGFGGTTFNGGINAGSGASGTASGGGAGGAGVNEDSAVGSAGGAGGGFGAAGTSVTGGAGGAAGFAVRKNGKTAAVTNNGTMTGAAS